jgi:hypothetical protein
LKTPAPVHKDDAMPDDTTTIELSLCELRAVAGYAAACARPALAAFERERPDDRRRRGPSHLRSWSRSGDATQPLRVAEDGSEN